VYNFQDFIEINGERSTVCSFLELLNYEEKIFKIPNNFAKDYFRNLNTLGV